MKTTQQKKPHVLPGFRTPFAPEAKNSNLIFEEWEMRVIRTEEKEKVKFSYSKNRMIRGRVKITKTEAATVNHGVTNNPKDSLVFMYLLPGAPAVVDNDYLDLKLPKSS